MVEGPVCYAQKLGPDSPEGNSKPLRDFKLKVPKYNLDYSRYSF